MTLPASMKAFLGASALTVGILGAGGSVGCGSSSTSNTGSVPSGLGLACTTTTSADASSVESALARAPSGMCVVLGAGSYAGPFNVPAGVALVAQDGARATITGGTAQDPALTLGEGAQIAGLDVVDAPGVAIAVRAANALVTNVTVTGAKNAALAVLCREAQTPGCATGTVTVTDVQLSTSTLGLWVSGAHVAMKGGSSSSHAGTGLTAAAGIIAQSGAKLDLDGVTIEKNEGVGVLVDGAATTASMNGVTVNQNGDRGIWAQSVAGSIAAPAVSIKDSHVTKNKIVGVGAVASHGIIIVGGDVSDTLAAPVVTNLQSTESIGDGVGTFTGSGDFKMDGTSVLRNARAAGVFDGSDRSIIIVGGSVVGASAGFSFVVQNSSSANVQIPASELSSPAKPLAIAAPTLLLPSVL